MDIVEYVASSEDVNAFIQEVLKPLVQGRPLGVVNAGMLATMIWAMGPADMTDDELIEGVKGASGWIALYIDSLRQAPGEVN